MRLALVVRTLGRSGGTERFVHGLAGYLAAAGHEVTAFCASVEDAPPGVRARPLGWTGRGRAWRLWRLHRAASAIPAGEHDLVLGFLRGGRPDLYRAGGGCHAAYRARIGGGGPADALEERLDRAVVAAARLVVVNSRLAGGELQRYYGVSPDKIRLVYNGVDLERFRPRPEAALPVPQPAICFFGSGFARKGLAAAVGALARLPGVHLAVIGGDPRPKHYKRLAERLGVADRVHLLGPTRQPEALLPAAKAMVLPTRYDPFANATLEALACGVPAITTAANGAAEILPEPWMAVGDPDDAAGLAGALERALQTPGLPARCRAVAEGLPAERAWRELERCVQELAT